MSPRRRPSSKTPRPVSFDGTRGLVLNADGTPTEASVLTKAFLLGFQIMVPLVGANLEGDDPSKWTANAKPGTPEWYRAGLAVASTEVAQRLGIDTKTLAEYAAKSLEAASPWSALRYDDSAIDNVTTVRLRLDSRLREQIDVECARIDKEMGKDGRTTLSEVVHDALRAWLQERRKADKA